MEEYCNKCDNINAEVKYASCDQEAFIKDRLYTVIRIAISIYKEKNVGADDNLINGALEGLINGVAIEIIQLFGIKPEYINLDEIKTDFIYQQKRRTI